MARRDYRYQGMLAWRSTEVSRRLNVAGIGAANQQPSYYRHAAQPVCA
jgi:hypothetical protein